MARENEWLLPLTMVGLGYIIKWNVNFLDLLFTFSNLVTINGDV